ncbi:MAG: hypothetical protein ACE5IR_21300, partial [bacterium]
MITQIKICRFVIRSIYCSIFALVFLSTANLEAKTFKVTNTNDSGPGSLRQAIIDANNHPGRDRIKFKIPGTAPQTIKTTSILPTITDPVDINGYSQTGARPNSNRTDRGLNAVLKIEIDGSLAGGVDGLSITAGSTTIRGLVMNHYAAAIVLLNKGRNRIHGNYLGTDITGTQAIGNSGFGVIVLNSPNNIIGGAKESESNLISGNGVDGVRIAFSTSTGNKIQGNLIGTDVTGKTGLGNNNDGIFFDNAPDNTVGGESSRARNILSSNGGSGIVFFDDGTFGNKVQGNFIGTDVTGKAGLGNQVSGVFIRGGATNNKIGGTSVRARNVISGNNFTGVTIFGSNTTDNIVEGNFIGVDRSG